MRIVVLGGAGKMGCIAVQALAGDERVDEVVIADVDIGGAEAVADYLDSPKVSLQAVDIHDEAAFITSLKGAGACLNATVFYTNLIVMEACLKAGVPYTDMGGLFHTTRKQLELHDRFVEGGVSAVLCMGSAPGVPNIQTRYAADRLDTIESIKIYDGIKPPASDEVRFPYAVPTIVDEITVEPIVFENGKFAAKPPMSDFEDYLFTPPLGLLPMHLSLHSEVATLPISFKDKGVEECFFKINYWGMGKEAVEKINVLSEFGFAREDPVEFGGQSVVPREFLVSILADYAPSSIEYLKQAKTKPPDWVKEIVTEIHGTKDDTEVTYRMGTLTCKGALPTGVAPAISAIWLAEGRIEPGVFPPEIALDPEPFFEELERHEIFTKETVTRMV